MPLFSKLFIHPPLWQRVARGDFIYYIFPQIFNALNLYCSEAFLYKIPLIPPLLKGDSLLIFKKKLFDKPVNPVFPAWNRNIQGL